MIKQNNDIDKLSRHPKVFYIYHITNEVYGIDSPIIDEYIIVHEESEEKHIGCPPNFIFYTVKEGFMMIDNNDMLPYICKALPKKDILKNHVDISIYPDPLKLRRNILHRIHNAPNISSYDEKERQLFTGQLIADMCFTVQIIEYHRIMNLKQPSIYVSDIYKVTDNDNLMLIINDIPYYKEIRTLTDGLYKQHIIKNGQL